MKIKNILYFLSIWIITNVSVGWGGGFSYFVNKGGDSKGFYIFTTLLAVAIYFVSIPVKDMIKKAVLGQSQTVKAAKISIYAFLALMALTVISQLANYYQFLKHSLFGVEGFYINAFIYLLMGALIFTPIIIITKRILHNRATLPVRVRAVIIQDQKILCIKRVKARETFWCCPGGAVEKGESQEQALTREIKEELGVDIKVKELYFNFASQKLETIGQMEHFYMCDIVSGTLGTGTGPEFTKNSGYVGTYQLEWVELKNIQNIDFRPRQLAEEIYKKLS